MKKITILVFIAIGMIITAGQATATIKPCLRPLKVSISIEADHLIITRDYSALPEKRLPEKIKVVKAKVKIFDHLRENDSFHIRIDDEKINTYAIMTRDQMKILSEAGIPMQWE